MYVTRKASTIRINYIFHIQWDKKGKNNNIIQNLRKGKPSARICEFSTASTFYASHQKIPNLIICHIQPAWKSIRDFRLFLESNP